MVVAGGESCIRFFATSLNSLETAHFRLEYPSSILWHSSLDLYEKCKWVPACRFVAATSIFGVLQVLM